MPKVQIRRIETYDLPQLETAVADFLGHANRIRIKRSKRVLLSQSLSAFPGTNVTTIRCCWKH